jgi:hypothetical protein
MNVRLHIERLVLEGLDVPHGGRAALQAAVEGELGRLIGEGGLAQLTGVAVPTVRAPQITAPVSDPASLGNAIASSVYRGVGGAR